MFLLYHITIIYKLILKHKNYTRHVGIIYIEKYHASITNHAHKTSTSCISRDYNSSNINRNRSLCHVVLCPGHIPHVTAMTVYMD